MGQVRNLIRRIADEAGVEVPRDKDHRFISVRAVIDALYDQGLIQKDAAEPLHNLYKLRSDVAHNAFEPEFKAAREYYSSAIAALALLDSTFEKLKDLPH